MIRKVNVKKRDQMMIERFTSIKEATAMLGYKSRTSIEHLVKTDRLDFVTFCPGTPSEIRMFYLEDIERILKEREE